MLGVLEQVNWVAILCVSPNHIEAHIFQIIILLSDISTDRLSHKQLLDFDLLWEGRGNKLHISLSYTLHAKLSSPT